jgi:hypothetical protein
MADAAEKVLDNFGLAGSGDRQVVIELNGLITKFRALLAKLDADAGVTDTNYVSTLDTGYSQIANGAGTVISA